MTERTNAPRPTSVPIRMPASARPYLALVVGIPLATVVAGLVTLWIALADRDATAPDRFIKHGLAITAPAAGTPQRP